MLELLLTSYSIIFMFFLARFEYIYEFLYFVYLKLYDQQKYQHLLADVLLSSFFIAIMSDFLAEINNFFLEY